MATIDLANFNVVKIGNIDLERNYINDILHALAARVISIEANSGIQDAPSDGQLYGRQNATWVVVPTGSSTTGTVTSVDVSGGTTGLTTSGGPVTSSGIITIAGTLVVASGGTGATTAAGARTNLGLGTAATRDVPASGDAAAAQVVLGNDTRLSGGATGGITIQLGPDPGLVALPPVLPTQIRYFQCPANYTFTAWQVETDISATISIDVRKHVFPNRPTGADSMTNSHPITQTAALSNTGNMSLWTTASVNRGDWIAIALTANNVATWLSLQLQGTKS